MVFTFASTGSSAYHNGQNLEIKLALQNADTISADTSNVTISVTNLTNLSENPTVTTIYNWQLNDILLGNGKYPNSSINNEGTVVTLNLPLDPSMKSVQVVAKENDKHGTERTLLSALVNIKSRPSTPTISVKSALTFSLNGAANGVMVTGGTLSVTPASGEGTTQILLFQRGTNSAGTNFMQQVASYPVPQTGPNTVIIHLATANLVDMQADSVNYLNVQSENDQGESNYSNSISFEASVRQATPKLLSAKSFENAKVTLTGSMNPVNASYYSVLGSSEYNPADPLQNWYPTNVTNVAITAGSQPAFTQSVTQFKGAVLASGQVYNFTLIQHATALLLNNNEVSVDPLLAAVPLTQSSISNVLSAVPLAYVPSNVALNASSQSFADNKLIFGPTITNAASIPPNMNAFFDFKVNGSSKGEFANATGSYSVPPATYYTVTGPAKGAHYELSLRLDYLLTAPQIAAITGTPALSIYTDPSTHFNYASVFSQSKTVVQNPSEEDVPAILDVALSTVSVGPNVALAVTHVAPSNTAMTTLGVDVEKYEIQMIRGTPGNPPNFTEDQLVSLNADGTKTLTVNAGSPSNIPGGPMDAAEYHILKQYSGGVVVPIQTGHHSARIRALFVSNSGIINGKWQYANFEMLEKALSAPASVSVSPALAPTGSNGSSVTVSYQAVPTSSVIGIPSGWSGVKAVAAVCSLYDKDGKILTGPQTRSFTSAEHTANPNGDVASSMTFHGLLSDTLLYARVRIIYQRLSQGGELMADVKEASQLQSALYGIKSDVTVASVRLQQTPNSQNARGLDSNGGNSFIVSATIAAGNNDVNSIQVKAIVPANVNGSPVYVHNLVYDTIKKEWTSPTLTPITGHDYSKNPVHIFVISSQNVDLRSH